MTSRDPAQDTLVLRSEAGNTINCKAAPQVIPGVCSGYNTTGLKA
ncbi:MAG: hypothetical protein NT154_32520 [Verrucomicrobia bacterium]|nr:hypothetical protein [Verrucomicrobiota bacterium]